MSEKDQNELHAERDRRTTEIGAAGVPDHRVGVSLTDMPSAAPAPPTTTDILAEIAAELYYARSMFPRREASAHEGYAVLLEEVHELWDEVRTKQSPERLVRMRKEAIQVAAMALRFIEDICDAAVDVGA